MPSASCRQFVSHALTHPGLVRGSNQDAYLDRPGLWAVADGMGGHEAGEYASREITARLATLKQSDSLTARMGLVQTALTAVDAHLRDQGANLGHGAIIASTVVALLVDQKRFACIWAGDSRAYLWRRGTLRQLTTDHSRVQELLSAGVLAPEAAACHPERHVVTQAVGGGRLAFGTLIETMVGGDRFLLCSDGLTNMLAKAEIAAELSEPSLQIAAQMLLDKVLLRGAVDNVTIVVIDCPQNA